eukprot:TRINITY_DN30924_c0_g1_i1.p2 TRINITY_DN30924_c0_g1~~TRINITY_DN30924_c0_g1_i1.p2  ORF type:complete len:199 (+),score=69.74 TRINITY_DN30924_c0_g1_i1:118-714(+)
MANNANDSFAFSRKLCVVGFPDVGKSALATRFVFRQFDDEHEYTVEQTLRKNVLFRGSKYHMEIVDLGGMELPDDRLHSHLTASSHGYIMVFSLTCRKSLEQIKRLRDNVLDSIGLPSLPMVLVGTKADLTNQRCVSFEEAQALANEWACGYVECSPKLNHRVDEVFQQALIVANRASDLEFVSLMPTQPRSGQCVIL